MKSESDIFRNNFDDFEQQTYLAGWRDAKLEEQTVGSWWFALLCFCLGLVCGLVF